MDDDTEPGPAAELPGTEEPQVVEVDEDPAPTDPAGFPPIAAPIYLPPPPPVPVPVRRRQHDFTPILIALAAVLVLGAGFTVTVLGESGRRPAPQARPTTTVRSSPTAGPSVNVARSGPLPPAASAPVVDPLEVSQATGMNAVLQESAGTFTEVNTAINQVSQCNDVAGATAGIAGAVQARSDQAGRAQALPVSALPDGLELQSLLVQSLQASGVSDTEYAQWAGQSNMDTTGIPTCVPGAPPAPSQADAQAGTLKGQFSALWTPLASRLGITTPSDY